MKNLATINHIRRNMFINLLILLTFLFGISTVYAQEGNQLEFKVTSFQSDDGQSSVQSFETTLDDSYFSSAGELDGLTTNETGLHVAEGETSGVYTSAPIKSPLVSTTDVTLLWMLDGNDVMLETRLSTDGGSTWSEWIENPEAFYPVRNDMHGGTIIWVDGVNASLQVRIILNGDTVLRNLTLTFNDSNEGPTDSQIAAEMDSIQTQVNVCPPSKPIIALRESWGCPDGQGSRLMPQYQPVTHVIIHHSSTPNYSTDWAKMVRSIWNYHANILGWGDVGYNYLIDPNGVIYEGRDGGDNVIAVHHALNRGGMLIGTIGCYGNCGYLGYSNAEPSLAMLDSVESLISWKFGKDKIDPHDFATYNGMANVPVIAGGRDVEATLSPGDYLYNKLGQIRTNTADNITCPTSCIIQSVDFDKFEYLTGETINMTVKLVDQQNQPIANANIKAELDKITASSTVASPPFSLIDRTGEYEGAYSNTSQAGTYLFKITASHPNNEFVACYAEHQTVVNAPPTTTPPPTPSEATVKIDPINLQAFLCESFEPSTAIIVKDAPPLGSISIEASYNPNIVQVRDADNGQLHVQVRPNEIFLMGSSHIIRNDVDTDRGKITFEAELLGEQTIEGNATLITVDWFPQSVGITDIKLDSVKLTQTNGTVYPHIAQNGTVEILSGCPDITGQVILQGRSNYAGVTVTNGDGDQVETNVNGFFKIAGGNLSIRYSGYLNAEGDFSSTTIDFSTSNITDGISLGSITLIAGDINQDNIIDIFDLSYMANTMYTDDFRADVNGDGEVNIFDLTLVAHNFRVEGPTNDWIATSSR